MICPSCNKFAAYDTSVEPEFELDVEVDSDGITVTGTCRIALTSECCGDELKEGTLEFEHTFPVEDIEAAATQQGLQDAIKPHLANLDEIEWWADADTCEVEERKIKGRRSFGIATSICVEGSFGGGGCHKVALSFEVEEFIPSGDMEELV